MINTEDLSPEELSVEPSLYKVFYQIDQGWTPTEACKVGMPKETAAKIWKAYELSGGDNHYFPP